MSQNPQGAYVATKTVDGVTSLVALKTDAETGALLTTSGINAAGDPASPTVAADGSIQSTAGGSNGRLNITVADEIALGAGRIGRVIVLAPGSGSGALTINDCAAVGDASTANQILTIAFGSLTVGQVINLDFPFSTGLVVSAVPGAGSPRFNISFNGTAAA